MCSRLKAQTPIESWRPQGLVACTSVFDVVFFRNTLLMSVLDITSYF